jgi:hypothetical protein
MQRWNDIKEPLLVFVVSYVFFLSNLAENFSGPHDSIAYLNSIISGYPLFHQHHLLYHFVSHYWLQLLQPVLPGVKDYFIVEAFTALWGSGSLTMIYLILKKRFLLSSTLSVIGTSLSAFSYGMWFYSVNVEVYAIPLFFILWSLYVLTRKPFTNRDLLLAIFLHCAAILFHQVNILFAVVILFIIWKHRASIPPVKAIAIYACTGILVVGGLYFLIGWVYEGNNNFAAWSQWVKGYSTEEDFWQPLSLKTPLHAGVGYSHAIVGGHYVFQLPVLKHYIETSLPFHALYDEMFLSKSISPAWAGMLTILTLIFFAALAILLFRFFMKFRTLRNLYPDVLPPLLVCWGIYTLFFCFWMPEILEFWILQTVLLWVILIGTLPVVGLPFRLPVNVTTIILSVILFTINYFGSIVLMQDITNDLYYEKVKSLRNVVNPKDIIVVQDAWILQDFLEYYTEAHEVFPAPDKPYKRSITDSAITATLQKNGRIYVYPEMNSVFRAPDTRYIDSLIQTFQSRTRLYRKEPLIWVIE